MSTTEPKKKREKPKRPPLGKRLGVREVKFAELYTSGGVTASQAYRDAGFPACPPATVHVRACRLLRRVDVQQLVHDLREEALAASRVSINRLAMGLARIAFADRADLFDENGCLLPPEQWPPDVRGTVESVESEELYETVAEEGEPRRRQLIGHVRKVRTAKRVEAMKILATWKRMIGRDSEVEAMDRELQRLRELLEEAKGRRHEEPR